MRGFALVGCLVAVLVLPASSSAAVSAGDTGWVWSNPLPQGGDLDAVAFSGTRGVAVGANGLVLRTDDAGATWAAAVSRTDADLTEVAMPDANTVYAGGGCVLRRSTDGGATFQRVAFAARETKCPDKLAQLAFPTPTVGYLILRDGTVLRTANGGRSFVRRASLQVGSSVPQDGASDVVFTSENVGIVSTGLYAPAFVRTDDGGQSWTSITPVDGNGTPIFSLVRGVDFVTPSVGFAVSRSQSGFTPAPMARTDDGGLTWTSMPLTGAAGGARSIDCADASTCVILAGQSPDGPGDRVTWTADGGLTGTTVTPGAPLGGLALSSATRVVGVGIGGATVASDDAGHTFTRVGGALPGEFNHLRWGGGRTVFAFPTDGTVARSGDGGLTWTALGAAPLGRTLDVSFAGDSVGYMLSGSGVLQRTEDGGATWEVLAGEAPGGRALFATGPDTLLVATAAGVLRSTDAGTTYARAAGSSKMLRAFDRAGKALVAVGPRQLLVSGDGGQRWRRLGRPGGGLIASADFVSSRRGFVVRADGEVFATSNGGRSWRLLTSVGRDDVAEVSFGDARRGFLRLDTGSGDIGGVLRTSDGGRTWRPQVLSGSRPLGAVVALGPGGGVALSQGLGHLFATTSGGDAGRRSTVTLRVVSRRRAGRRTLVTLGGRLKPAAAGAGVAVTARIGGTWYRKFARVSRGRYRTTFRLRRGAVFVAQWRGAPGVQGDGTPALRVRLRR